MPEQTDDEILELIRNAKDESYKGLALALFQINRHLADSIKVQQEQASDIAAHRVEFAAHRVEFAQHVTDERALFNRGIGAWKAVALGSMFVVTLFGIIGSLGIYILNSNISDVKATANEVKITALRNSEQDTAIKVLEAELKGIQMTQERNTFLLDNALVRSPVVIQKPLPARTKANP